MSSDPLDAANSETPLPEGAPAPSAPREAQQPPQANPKRMSTKEWLILLGIMLFVSAVIWLSTAQVWNRVFSIEETPAPASRGE